jgi:hypothetical protein
MTRYTARITHNGKETTRLRTWPVLSRTLLHAHAIARESEDLPHCENSNSACVRRVEVIEHTQHGDVTHMSVVC